MELLSNFLTSYAHITPPDAIVRRTLADLLAQKYNFSLSQKNIRVIRGVAYLDISPAAKSAVFLHKDELLALLSEVLGKGIVMDIR